MGNALRFELAQKHLSVLKQFFRVLTEEREAIISFSLEGIIRANNVKEELLKKLEFLEGEEARLAATEGEADKTSPEWSALLDELAQVVDSVRIALEKNMRLLTFSMDHVRSSIEKMVSFINRASYGGKRRPLSIIVSKEV